MEEVALPALDHVIVVTCSGGAVYFRVYAIELRKSGTKIPDVELVSMGPSLNFELRRSQLASADLAKSARYVPKEYVHALEAV